MIKNSYNLSNFEVKVYLKKDNKKAFHFKTNLIFETNNYFPSTDLEIYNCTITLSNGKKIKFDKSEKVVSETDYDYSFNGIAKVIQLKYETITELKDLKNSLILVELVFKFKSYNFKPEKEYILQNYGVLKIINNERNFEI